MKQILQNARTGGLELAEVPAPAAGRGQVLVRNRFSAVSPGTEKLALSFARKSLLGKARSRPDLVAQVTRKLRQEGPMPTYRTVMSRLDAPQPLGYSCAGVVVAVGAGVTGFAPGDAVACAGAGYANHAEFVTVPENLVAHVPDDVPLEHAAFATLGAIALQGLRVAEPTLGEIGAVVGLGIIGQLSVQLLRANGCRVVGLDLDPARVKDAQEQGAEWALSPDAAGASWRDTATGGHGVDFALVTASSDSAAPLSLAAELCRHKGRISVVGAMPMELDRRTFYEKELDLRMSTSYGPGRYDRTYEEGGLDYPLPYVRWTENRNLQSFLALLASRDLDLGLLQPELVSFDRAVEVYDDLAKGSPRLAVAFEYGSDATPSTSVAVGAPTGRASAAGEGVGVAFLGAGNYAKGVLMPALQGEKSVRPVRIVTATGPSALRTGERFGFTTAGTDPEEALQDPAVDLVFVATRHDSHADLAARALRAGKAVWVEKPVGLDREQVEHVAEAARETQGFLVVGYNRRFSPHARAVRAAFEKRHGPLAIQYTVAAGAPPRGTWVTDPREGGGRIVGEACHFVDLCTYLVGSPPVSVFARRLSRDPEVDDSTVAMLGFSDGSTATIQYLARTSSDLPKERFEASADGITAISDNFRTTRVSGRKELKTFNQDKGQVAALSEVVHAVEHRRPAPFTLLEIVAVSRATLAIEESAATGLAVPLD